MKIIIYIAVFFISYSIGRISHILGGHLNTPHHWIYGVIALIVGIIFHREKWSIYLILFGIGFIISDFTDMIDLKFYGVDDVKIKKFWGVD
jgi:predicted alpha/beta hydrolase